MFSTEEGSTANWPAEMNARNTSASCACLAVFSISSLLIFAAQSAGHVPAHTQFKIAMLRPHLLDPLQEVANDMHDGTGPIRRRPIRNVKLARLRLFRGRHLT